MRAGGLGLEDFGQPFRGAPGKRNGGGVNHGASLP
jgi:hypothetical protein